MVQGKGRLHPLLRSHLGVAAVRFLGAWLLGGGLLVSGGCRHLGLSDAGPPLRTADTRTGNVLFIHPDGSSLQAWGAMRALYYGPDGRSHWDRLPYMAVYTGHMNDALAATSHGGATSHAYGVKVPADSYGMNHRTPLTALSGFEGSIMQEAMTRGHPVGVINSGHIGEPGTGVFLASAPRRADVEAIAADVVRSGADVILCGGEVFLLPEGERGRHGQPGRRRDGRDLFARARELGYTVVRTRGELARVDPGSVDRLLGIFAAEDTYNDLSEEELRERGLASYDPAAPTVAEMLEVALPLLERRAEETGRPFLLVLEEEGSDNFANHNNASGTLEALYRADQAIGLAHRFVRERPGSLLITAADSDASSLGLVSPGLSYGRAFEPGVPLPATMSNGAPLDGAGGTATPPFVASPDRAGRRLTFGIAWAGLADFAGGILVRAAGAPGLRLGLLADNTDVYRMMYATLFGEPLPGPGRE